jgi:hypothetical protein
LLQLRHLVSNGCGGAAKEIVLGNVLRANRLSAFNVRFYQSLEDQLFPFAELLLFFVQSLIPSLGGNLCVCRFFDLILALFLFEC